MFRCSWSLIAFTVCAALLEQLPAQTKPPGLRNSPALDKTWRITVHNAYWHGVSGIQGDAFADGPKQHMLDTLYIDRARGLEFDLHSNHGERHFQVYHTNFRANYSLCLELADCLAIMKTWHLTNPGHDPLFLHFEAKETDPRVTVFAPNGLTPQHLDGFLVNGLSGPGGNPIFSPKDYLAWCEAKARQSFDEDLRGAVAVCGWPTLDFLRNRIILTFHGNANGNAHQVYDYSHAYGRKIRDVQAFPLAGATGKGSLDSAPCSDSGHPDSTYAGNVCNWDQHSVMLDLGTTDPGQYPDTSPMYPSPARTVSKFKEDHGLIRSEPFQDFGNFVDAIRHLIDVDVCGSLCRQPGFPVSGFNLISTDAPRATPLNDYRYSPNRDGLKPWAAGCLEYPSTLTVFDCDQTALAEPNSGIQVLAKGLGPEPGLGPNKTADNVYFMERAILAADAEFRAFISTRTNSHLGDKNQADANYGDNQTGRWGCLMARQGPRPTFPFVDPPVGTPMFPGGEPFFAVCRLRHRLNWGTTEDGIFVLWRPTANAPTQQIHLGGHNELDPYVSLKHENGGACWTAYARVTDNPDIAPVGLRRECFTNALRFVGLATDGGSRSEQGYLGEYLFGSVLYGGTYQRATYFRSQQIGDVNLNGSALDRSYLDGICAADVTGSVTVAGGGFARNGISQNYSQRITITNTTNQKIAGPIRVAFNGLPAGVVINGPVAATTKCQLPSLPAVETGIASLEPFQSATFVVIFGSPAGTQIKYTPQVLGSGRL